MKQSNRSMTCLSRSEHKMKLQQDLTDVENARRVTRDSARGRGGWGFQKRIPRSGTDQSNTSKRGRCG